MSLPACLSLEGNSVALPLAVRWRRPLLALIVLECVLLFAPTVGWLYGRWTMSVWQNAHGMFVPPVVVWLVWRELKDRSDLQPEGSAWGFAFLVPALLLHAIDAGIHTQLLSAFALFLSVPGMVLLLLGRTATRLVAFPLALLMFALPIPLVFTEPVQLTLRHLVAAITAFVMPIFGISVFLEGTTLHTTAGIVEIADACAGVSTLYAAFTVACIVAYTTHPWQRRVLLLVAAAPVAIAANVIRVIALSLMVAFGQSWLLATFVHPLSGLMTFALALPVLFWLGSPKPAEAVQ